MNENENKINNENEQNNAPKAEGDDSIKAFGWKYTGEESEAPETSEAQESNEAEEITKECPEAEENEPSNEAELAEENEESDAETKKKAKTKKENPHGASNFAVTLSAILSATAILLLVAMAIASTLGLLGGSGAIRIPVATPDREPSYSTDSDMLEEFMDSVVIIKAELDNGSSVGTGIILSENGYIMTNHHVIENAKAVYVWRYGSYL